jgi:hypothetical protein
MAKGQQRQPKEKKKPKQEGSKPVSGYKAAYGGGGSATPSLGAKKPGT